MNLELEEAIKNDELIIFTGSGISIPLGFPNWIKLISIIISELNQRYQENNCPINFKYYLNQGNNLDVFKVLKELERHCFKPEVKSILYDEIVKINFNNSELRHQEKIWTICDKIISTNYDKALEEVKPERVKVFTSENVFQQNKILNSSPFLFKIHGDIDNPDSCILFETDYEKLYESDNPTLSTLKNLLLNKTLLFLGFSMKDPYIEFQLRNIYKLYNGFNRNHFIVLTNPLEYNDLNLKPILIKDWDEDFYKFLNDLSSIEKRSKNTSEVIVNKENIDISLIDDILLLRNIYTEKLENYSKVSSAEQKINSQELHKLKDKILEIEAKKMDLDFELKIPNHKEEKIKYLFDSIYKSEKLKPEIIAQIIEIKNQESKDYNWYHRSVIVSAIACSLINYKSVDNRKIELLIDFTNDSEEKVWQKSITYLFLILNHLGNKWLRYPSVTKKLTRLKDSTTIQKSLSDIIIIIQLKFHNTIYLGKRIFENDHFKDSPFNYFMPFFDNNPSINNLYEDDKIENIEELLNYIREVPLPDSLKYLICNNSKVVNNKEKGKSDRNDKTAFMDFLHLNAAFEPFLNYINEFLNFYQNYPLQNEIFTDDISIVTVNNLKKHVLNAIEHRKVLSRQFIIQNEWGNAIPHLETLIKDNLKDFDSYHNLAYCYIKKGRVEDAIKLRMNLEKENPSDLDNIIRLGKLFFNQKEYTKSLAYYEKSLELTVNPEDSYFSMAECYEELGKFNDALNFIEKAIKLNSSNDKYHYLKSLILYEKKQFSKSLASIGKSINLNPSSSGSFLLKGTINDTLGKYDEALEDYNKSIEFDVKRIGAYSNKANLLRKMGELEVAMLTLEEGFKYDSKDGALLGTKATIFSAYNKDEEFFYYLEKAFQNNALAKWLDDDIKEKYFKDQKFINLLEKYNQKL